MKKHFLILMVMALLPMAGWADITFGTVQLDDYTYGGAKLPIPLVKDSEGSILEEDTYYEVDYANAYTDAACSTANAVALKDMKGNTTYFIKITGINAFAGKTTSQSFTCKKKALTVTVTKTFQRDFGATTEPTIASSDWSVTGLVTTSPWSDTKDDLGDLEYNYAGKGNKDYAGGEYPITFFGLTSDCYEISYPTDMKFTIVGTNMNTETVTVKDGTELSGTYKGTKFTASDFSGLVLMHGTTELTQGTDFDIELNDPGIVGSDGAKYTQDEADAYNLSHNIEAIDYNAYVVDEYFTSAQVTEYNDKCAGAVTTSTQITAEHIAAIKAYNATLADVVTTDDWKELPIVAVPAYVNAGAYSYDVKFKGNYSGTKANFSTLTINKAPLSVDVNDIEVTYQSAAYTDVTAQATAQKAITYYGIVANDVANRNAIIADITGATVTVAQTGGATLASEDGYALKITDATAGTDAAKNYKVTTFLNTGKLIIKKMEVKLFAKAAEKSPNTEDPDFELATYTLAGADYLDAETVAFTRAEGEEVGGKYDITPNVGAIKVYNGTDDAKKEVTSNYNLVAGTPKGQLSINKAALTITIKDQSKFYGDDDPATIAAPVEGKNYIVTGLVSGDEISSITLTKSWAAETVGTYVLGATVTNTGADHYSSVTVVPGTFEIKKAVLTATLPIKTTASGVTIAASATPSKDGIVIDGFKKGETDAQKLAAYAIALNNATGVLDVDGEDKLKNQTVANGYVITLTTTAYANYTFLDGTTETDKAFGKLIVGTGDAAAVALADDAIEGAVNSQYAAITGLNGETRDVTVELNRTRTIGGKERKWAKAIWNTMVLPFATTPRAISNALGYAIVNVVNPEETTEGNVKFKLNMYDEIPANTPFFVKTDADIADGFVSATFDDVEIKAPSVANPSIPASSEAIGYKFVGTYTAYTIDGDNKAHLRFRLGNVDSWNKIGNGFSATWTIRPFEAYIDLGVAAAAREVIFTFEELDGSFTAIRSIDIDKQAEGAGAAEGWYNLNGMKLQGAPAQKGIYIKNGKKVVVK